MASQEEDNKLECISNVNKEQERYYLNVYKKYDSILNDKSEIFENKVSSLIEVWSSISELNLSQFDIRYVIQIIDWAKLHALNIVLTGEWKSTEECFRNSLLESIEKAQNSLATVNDAFSSRCQKLADVVRKPWEDPVLANLIQEKDVEIGPKEIEFFCVETAYLVSVRLKKLCENQCEDLALNLVTNFLNYKKLAAEQNFNLNATETQLWFIFDIYIALLYKYQDKAKIIQQFEELQLEEGVLLIKRFAKKRVKISKIWRNCQKIAIFGSRFFMSRALMKYTEEYKEYVTELLKTYLGLSNTEVLLQEFVLSVRNITNLADAAGLCVMCEVIHREAADKLRVFAIEMYIRALTTDMNELERLKHVNEEDKVKSTTSRLANTFTNLADLLDDHVKVARECVLTAFSLEPTKERLKRIEELAKRSGFPVLDTGQEWKCRLHPPVLPSDDLAWVCPECGEWMCKPELTAPLQMNMALHEALQESVLGISEALCDDLVVCLSNPRYQILSWLLAWGDLYRLCILYLNDPEKTKNFVTELKFVDVDYSMFEHIKREPVDEFTGIEKGYEQYLDLDFVSDEETSSVSEDSMSHDRSVGLGSDGAGEPYLSLPQPKSDPITLKSLRMFRPNLKRKKEDSDSPTTDKKSTVQMDSSSSSSSSSSSVSSLQSYLTNRQYHPQSEYSVNIPATNRTYSTQNMLNNTLSSSTYLAQAAGVTKQSTPSNSNQVSATSNFSSFEYLSTYGAKFGIPKQLADNFDQVNSRIQTSFSSTVAPMCYPPKLPEQNSLNLQTENSIFNTANLSSATSTSYVSNIIKNTLSYGVPKVIVTNSTYTSAIPSETIANSHSFASSSVSKQGLFTTPKQLSFSSSNLTSQKNTSRQSSSVTPSLSSQKSSTQQGTFTPHTLTVQKNTSQQVTHSAVPDLEALLNEIDANKFETDSKNGVAATLLQLGGQVAKNQKQSIQVPQQPSLSQIPMKSPQETFLPNGTKEGCKMRPKNSTKLDKPNLHGVISDQTTEPPCKVRKLVHESNPDKINSHGKTMFRLMELQVKIPKLNLENYSKPDKHSPTGIILDQKEITPQTQKVLPTIQSKSLLEPSNYEVSSLPLKCPPEKRQPLEIKQLSVPLTQCKPLLLLKPEHSTLLQDKSPSQTEVPAVSVHRQTQTVVKQEFPILTCPKEQSSMLQEVPHQEATIHSVVQPQQAPESHLKLKVNKEPCHVPRRVESVIIIPPVKAQTIISQALLKQPQDNKPLLKEPVSELHSASISLVKNQKFPETTNTSHSLLKTGVNNPLRVSNQYFDKKLVNQKKYPATCTLADSLRIITPITMDCDKDKNVQKDNQKTDVKLTEVVEEVTSLTAEDNNNHCISQVSLKKTDVGRKTNVTKQVSAKCEVFNTQNIKDSIMTDSDLASDKIRIENQTEKFDYSENREHNSNKNDIIAIEKTIDNALKKEDHVNDSKMVEIVNKNLDCDKKKANVVQTNIEPKQAASNENKPTVERMDEIVQDAAQWNTKDEDVTAEKNIQKNCPDTKLKTETINILGKLQENKIIKSKQRYENMEEMTSINTYKINKPNKKHCKILVSNQDNNIKVGLGKNKKKTEHVNSSGISSHQRGDILPTQELKEAAVYAVDHEFQIGENVVMAEDIQESDKTMDIDTIPTVNEIKENILQSIRNQEVIKTKTVGIKRKRCQKCNCRQDITVKIGTEDPFNYIRHWHNYCEGPKPFAKTLKQLSKRESSPMRLQLGRVHHKKTIDNRSLSVLPSKCRSNLREIAEGPDKTEIKDKYLLFTDASSETYADLNKENIKMSSDDSTTDTSVHSSEELDNEDGATSNESQGLPPRMDFELEDKYTGFYKQPIFAIYDKSNDKVNNQNVKKYSNTHKRKHENVPCFKIDQEKNTRKSNRSVDRLTECRSAFRGHGHLEQSQSDTDDFIFEPRDFSVLLQRLDQRISRPAPDSEESIIELQERLRRTIRQFNNIPICVLYNKEKQTSPLQDFNVGNQVKKKRVKKQKPDYIRNKIKKGGIVKKKSNLPKSGILKRKSDFCSKKPKHEKHVRFNLKPQVLCPETKKKSPEHMLESVPGLNDFLEIGPIRTEHVVNVVQVSGSRSSTVTNQNIQTSTQVSPHIQRIGQPKHSEHKSDRLEGKSEQSTSSSATTTIETVKPSTSQSTGIVDILGSKPSQKSSVTPRQTPYINILSQQIVKQPVLSRKQQQLQNEQKLCAARLKQTEESITRDKTATVIKVEPEENVDVQDSKSVNTNVKIVTSTTQACGAASTATSSTQGGTILQFICKSSLPKFQQAFGKTVYQSNSSNDGATEVAGSSTTENLSQTQTATVLETKKIATKAVPVNVQPIAGNVIFRGQVPVGQTVSLIPPGSNTRQLFRITGSTHEQISLVKETVIQNKMSALLAAALQGKPKITEQNGELVEEYSATRITLCRPGAVPPNATRIVKPVQLQIPANVIRAPQPNLSSTTLEQLREFDMVYKQVKERSSNPAQPENTVQSSQESPQQQRISFTYVNQVQKYTQLSPVVVVSSYSPIQQTVSPALSVTSQSGTGTCLTQVSTVTVPKAAVKTSKGKNIKSSAVTKTSPTAVPTIPKPQQKPQEDEHTTQRIFDILAEYAEQLRNSPDLNNKPAPRRRSNPPTNPSSNTSGSSSSKKKKKKSSSSTTSNLVETDNEDLTMGSEDSSGGNVVQLSMTDEEQSQSASITPPETNLEPATSNTPTPRPLIVADTSSQPRNVIITDSNVGEALKMPNTALIMPGSYIMPVSVVKGGQQIAVVSGGSKILTTVPTRSGQNMLLFQSFVNQSKKGGISAVKYSTIQPFSGISSQSVAGVSAQPPVVLPSNSVATVALGQPITLKKLDDNERGTNTELLLTISQSKEAIKLEQSPEIPQPDSSTSLSSDAIEVKIEEGSQSDSSSNEVFTNIQKTNSVATSVIASVVKKEQEERSDNATADTTHVKEEPSKQVERIGSVLVNASTSNGPMLSHTNPRYRKPPENVESANTPTKEFNHTSGKAPTTGTKIFKNNAVYYAIRTKKAVSKKVDSEMQKQAAMERELRLQKSLSEECEDLGVDEPSTSDLFPEADLLFDSNHSPSYDQTGQRIQVTEVKAKASLNLFSDDENSGPMRHDLFDYVEYHSSETSVDQINGNNASNESASSCDDTTLLPNCGTMSEVTLNSPISPEYTDNTHAINKYKYKYTNRKKGEKATRPQTDNWSEVTSTEDTIEIAKEDETPIAVQEETVIDEPIAEVETIMENERFPEKELVPKCPIHGPSDHRGSRRNLRKPCSCFNGSKSPTTSNAKRRVTSPKSQTPTPSKKPLVSKKR